MGTWAHPISRRRKFGGRGQSGGSLCLEMFLRHLSEELLACREHPGAWFQGSASWLNPVSENTGAFPAQEGPCRGLGSQPHVRAQAGTDTRCQWPWGKRNTLAGRSTICRCSHSSGILDGSLFLVFQDSSP